MRRLSLLLILALGCSGASHTAPATPTTTTPGATGTGSAVKPARGMSEHDCALEGQGFDCTGCQVSTGAAEADLVVNPTCKKKEQTCPRVCCNLCPKE